MLQDIYNLLISLWYVSGKILVICLTFLKFIVTLISYILTRLILFQILVISDMYYDTYDMIDIRYVKVDSLKIFCEYTKINV